MQTTITFAVSTALPVAKQNEYEVDPHGRFVWLQKLAYKILAKYGRHPVSTQPAYKTQTVSVDSLMAALGALIASAAHITSADRFVAVIGAKQWAEIRRQDDVEVIARPLDLTIPIPERLARRFREARLRSMPGIRVIVLSWYDGIAVIPAYLWGR